MSDFPLLLSPGAIGSLRMRNRIAMAPMGVNLGEDDGTVGDRLAAWFEARARGGAGLVIVGSASVAYPHASTDRRQVAASEDAHLPGLTRLTSEAHSHGATIAAQLVHNGTNSLLDIAEGRPMLVPSKKGMGAQDELSRMITTDEATAMMAPFASPKASYEIQVATDDDLMWAIDRFVDSALRCQRAGFDGIELHAGHGYLLHAFLSPATNQRTDRWGGSPEARAELFVAVVRAVRSAVGPTYPLWARVGAFEAHRDPGQRIDDAITAMGLGLDAGLDAIHVTAYGDPMVATGIVDGHTPHLAGALLEHAARVKRDLSTTVIAMGRLTPESAEQALVNEAADIIAMGRPLIADPELPRKLAGGSRDKVRPCAYQYRCIGAIFTNDPVMCSVNPDAGHEAEPAPASSTPPKHVVVAGGGPAGLECARRLAERGHHVELWEATDRLGGLLCLAEQADPDLLGLRDWLVGAATDAGVEVRLETPATDRTVATSSCDALVWAVGGDWSASGGDPAIDDIAPWLGDRSDLAVSVTIHGSSKAAASLAESAARHGMQVTLATDDPVIAPELGLPGRFRLVADLERAGVHLTMRPDEPVANPSPSTGSEIRIGCTGRQPPLVQHGSPAVHVIGDAAGTSGLALALAAAARVAAEI
ncbi:MAG: FAD-dependent oxidoreductase [Acidimicrobiales bacterium]